MSLLNDDDRGFRPGPDPSTLTTAQLVREIASLKEIVFTRLEGMDRAITLSHDNFTRVPTDTDKQIGHLKELIFERFEVSSEKFRSIDKQFAERDTRTEQSSKDSKVAVDAALQAAKEAVGEQNKSSALAIAKSEASTNKQIDQLGVLIQSTGAGLNDKIDDLKTRTIRVEGQGIGQKDEAASQQTTHMNSMSIIGLIVGIVLSVSGLVLSALPHLTR